MQILTEGGKACRGPPNGFGIYWPHWHPTEASSRETATLAQPGWSQSWWKVPNHRTKLIKRLSQLPELHDTKTVKESNLIRNKRYRKIDIMGLKLTAKDETCERSEQKVNIG